MCNNGACVGHNQVCDFSDDCGDSSDESSCGEISQNAEQFILIEILHALDSTLIYVKSLLTVQALHVYFPRI